MPMESRIEEAYEKGICPQCGRPIASVPRRERTGTGRIRDGLFCSLNCLANFHEGYFADRITQGTPSDN